MSSNHKQGCGTQPARGQGCCIRTPADHGLCQGAQIAPGTRGSFQIGFCCACCSPHCLRFPASGSENRFLGLSNPGGRCCWNVNQRRRNIIWPRPTPWCDGQSGPRASRRSGPISSLRADGSSLRMKPAHAGMLLRGDRSGVIPPGTSRTPPQDGVSPGAWPSASPHRRPEW